MIEFALVILFAGNVMLQIDNPYKDLVTCNLALDKAVRYAHASGYVKAKGACIIHHPEVA